MLRDIYIYIYIPQIYVCGYTCNLYFIFALMFVVY